MASSYLSHMTNEEMQDKMNKENRKDKPEYLKGPQQKAEEAAQKEKDNPTPVPAKLSASKIEIMTWLEEHNLNYDYVDNNIIIKL